jgi:hypothetical protein
LRVRPLSRSREMSSWNVEKPFWLPLVKTTSASRAFVLGNVVCHGVGMARSYLRVSIVCHL